MNVIILLRGAWLVHHVLFSLVRRCLLFFFDDLIVGLAGIFSATGIHNMHNKWCKLIELINLF